MRAIRQRIEEGNKLSRDALFNGDWLQLDTWQTLEGDWHHRVGAGELVYSATMSVGHCLLNAAW